MRPREGPPKVGDAARRGEPRYPPEGAGDPVGDEAPEEYDGAEPRDRGRHPALVDTLMDHLLDAEHLDHAGDLEHLGHLEERHPPAQPLARLRRRERERVERQRRHDCESRARSPEKEERREKTRARETVDEEPGPRVVERDEVGLHDELAAAVEARPEADDDVGDEDRVGRDRGGREEPADGHAEPDDDRPGEHRVDDERDDEALPEAVLEAVRVQDPRPGVRAVLRRRRPAERPRVRDGRDSARWTTHSWRIARPSSIDAIAWICFVDDRRATRFAGVRAAGAPPPPSSRRRAGQQSRSHQSVLRCASRSCWPLTSAGDRPLSSAAVTTWSRSAWRCIALYM